MYWFKISFNNITAYLRSTTNTNDKKAVGYCKSGLFSNNSRCCGAVEAGCVFTENHDLVNAVDHFLYDRNASIAAYGPINCWEVSEITEMNMLFSHSNFNEDISCWNISQAKNMGQMFESATNFNQNLCSWFDTLNDENNTINNMTATFNNSGCTYTSDPDFVNQTTFCRSCTIPTPAPACWYDRANLSSYYNNASSYNISNSPCMVQNTSAPSLAPTMTFMPTYYNYSNGTNSSMPSMAPTNTLHVKSEWLIDLERLFTPDNIFFMVCFGWLLLGMWWYHRPYYSCNNQEDQLQTKESALVVATGSLKDESWWITKDSKRKGKKRSILINHQNLQNSKQHPVDA